MGFFIVRISPKSDKANLHFFLVFKLFGDQLLIVYEARRKIPCKLLSFDQNIANQQLCSIVYIAVNKLKNIAFSNGKAIFTLLSDLIFYDYHHSIISVFYEIV